MSILDQHWFSKISRPSRYLGNEINAVKKEPAQTEICIALVFPDVYEVGMSHLGLKILYHILNGHDWLAAERAFSPWPDLEQELRRRGLAPTSLESNKPLSRFDILGFSLQHELSYTNVLTMLNLSNIPFKELERIIIGGGGSQVLGLRSILMEQLFEHTDIKELIKKYIMDFGNDSHAFHSFVRNVPPESYVTSSWLGGSIIFSLKDAYTLLETPEIYEKNKSRINFCDKKLSSGINANKF